MALSLYANVQAAAIAPPEGGTSTRESTGDTSTRVQKAREELVCSICIETLREPRTLTCQHTFCTACLKELASARTPRARRRAHSPAGAGEEAVISCPECRANIILPEKGIYGEFSCIFSYHYCSLYFSYSHWT